MKKLLKAAVEYSRKSWVHLALIVVGTILMVYQYVFPLDGFIPYRNDYLEDSGQMTWNLWFVAESILGFDNPFVTDMVFYPVGTNLATHTLVSGWFPVTILVKLLSGNSPFYGIYAFNIVILLSYLGLAIFTFLALRKLHFGFWASLIPAWGYAFCSFYYWHWKHLNLMGMFTFPMVFYLAILIYETPTRRRLLALSVALAWSVYITEMSIFTAMGIALFVLLALVFPSTRQPLIQKIKALGFLNIGVAAVLFLVMISPFLYHYALSDITEPDRRFFSSLSTNAAALFLPAKSATWLYGNLFEPLASKIDKGLGGREAFLGIPIIIFFLVGLIRRQSIYAVFSLVIGFFFLLLGFGPTLKFLNVDTGIWLPYGSLMDVPPFTQNRCPVRITLIGTFLLMPVTALGLQRTFTYLKTHLNPYVAHGVLILTFVWTVVEKYTPPPQPRFSYKPDLAAIDAFTDGPVISTSMPSRACNQAVFQTFHKRPIANFCHARTTEAQMQHMIALRSALRRGPDSYAALLKEKEIKNIYLDNRLPFVTVDGLRNSVLTVVDGIPHPKRAIKAIGVAESGAPRSKTNRTEWNLSKGETIRIDLDKPTRIFSFELLADAEDRYRVSFFNEDERVHTSTLETIRKKRGLEWRILDIWNKNVVADNLEISVKGGLPPFNIAAAVVTER